jgi:hypothetical protein
VSTNCPQCGAPLARGAKACSNCGAPVVKARGQGFSIWWIIIPTLVYAYLSRDVVMTLILAALGAGLGFAQRRKEVPAKVRPFLPLLQLVLVFIFLGGSPFAVLLVAAAGAAVIWKAHPIIRAMEPWWQVQQQIPILVRRVVGIFLAAVIGYFFAARAGGNEWTYTFLSIVLGTVVVFLLSFTPPDSVRASPMQGRPGSQRPI